MLIETDLCFFPENMADQKKRHPGPTDNTGVHQTITQTSEEFPTHV